jgi:malonate decarboxylase delta subunit
LVEHLEFAFAGGGGRPRGIQALVGVVGSGNLEVLIERAALNGGCAAVIDTSVTGFADLWRQVLEDFFTRQRLADVRVSIHDGGATPAIVRLRLDQAAAEIGVA